MEYRIIGELNVHDLPPGTIVEVDESWNVEFLLATGHLEPVKSSAQKTKTIDPSESGEKNA
jgi:hypothetical protein